jgi:hypothetical protein
MAEPLRVGDCVRVPDGRTGRLRARTGGRWKVRVRRRTSKTHQFLVLEASEVSAVATPEGWMSAAGYRRYLRAVEAAARKRGGRRAH